MVRNKKKATNKIEFSKTLLIQESALIWVMTLGFLILAFVCILKGYQGSLPWLAAMASFPWAAYGVSQACYYKKSTVENSEGGIKYETVLTELQKNIPPIDDINMDQSGLDADSDIDIWGPI